MVDKLGLMQTSDIRSGSGMPARTQGQQPQRISMGLGIYDDEEMWRRMMMYRIGHGRAGRAASLQKVGRYGFDYVGGREGPAGVPGVAGPPGPKGEPGPPVSPEAESAGVPASAEPVADEAPTESTIMEPII